MIPACLRKSDIAPVLRKPYPSSPKHSGTTTLTSVVSAGLSTPLSPSPSTHGVPSGLCAQHSAMLPVYLLWDHLLLDISETKEVMVDFRRKQQSHYHHPLLIRGAEVETVETFIHFGVTISRDSWTHHIKVVMKKVRQHLHLLRQLRDVKLPNGADFLNNLVTKVTLSPPCS